MPPELLRLWRDEFWIFDSGMIAEAEFNLVPNEQLAQGGLGDAFMKLSLIPDEGRHPFVKGYFHRHIGSYNQELAEDCRNFLRQSRVSAMLRTLAEALYRTHHLDGEEVIDTLLANRATVSSQMDLFWKPVGYDPFIRHRSHQKPQQMTLL